MKRFVYIEYFWDLLHLYFTSIESVKKSIEGDIEDIKNVKGTKVGQISGKRCVGKISWCLGLLHISKKVFATFLSKFLFVFITGW